MDPTSNIRERLGEHRWRLAVYLAVVAIVIAAYTVAYQWGMAALEGRPRSFAAALQTVVQSMTTTGYGQDAPWSTDAMNLLAVAMQFTGILLIFLILPVFVVPWFERLVERRRLTAVEPLSGHVVVCRAGPSPGGLLGALEKREIPYVVVEPDREEALGLHESGRNVLNADPEATEALERAWIGDASATVIVGEDRPVLNVALAVGEAAPHGRLVATVERERMGRHVRYAGADMVLRPRRILAQGLATRVLSELPGAGDLVEVEHGFTLAEIPVEEGSRAAGRQAGAVAEREAVRLLGVWRDGRFRAEPGTRLAENDNLVVGGQLHDIERVRRDVVPPLPGETGVLVLGHGTVGSEVAGVLAQSDADMTVVDREEGEGVDVIGDATDEGVLLEAGVADADAVVIAVSDDSDAVVAALLVREHAADARVFVRANEDTSLDRLARAGTDEAVSLAHVTGRLLALNVTEGVLAQTRAGTAVMRVSADDIGAERVGDLELGDGCVLAVVERSGRLELGLDEEFSIEAGDALVLVGDAKALRRWREP